jgi:hypothetical protein
VEEYTPNSHKFKREQQSAEEREKAPKVVSGKVTKKKNEIRKMKDVFISEDAGNVKSYIVMDVLIPAIKNTILDIIIDSAKMVFGGGSRDKGRSVVDKVSYRNYYTSRDDNRRPSTINSYSRFDYDDLVFESRGEAEAVIMQMDAMIEKYGYVTVGDLYDMVEMSAPYTANKYGWTSVANAKAVPIRGGYILKLPKAAPIED